jgi:hypothetical protein
LGIQRLASVDVGREVHERVYALGCRSACHVESQFCVQCRESEIGVGEAGGGRGGVSEEFVECVSAFFPTTPAFEFPRKGLNEQVKSVGPLLPVVSKGWERWVGGMRWSLLMQMRRERRR